MIGFILRRLISVPIIMLLVTAILFALILQLPVDQRVQIYVPSSNPHLTEEQYRALLDRTIERYGLNRPFPVQYVNWIRNVLRGDFGYSPTWRTDVSEAMRTQFPATVELSIFSAVPAILFAALFGGLAARYYHRWPDVIIRFTAFVGWALPSFILGLVLIKVFYARLNWFPIGRLSLWANTVVNSEGFRAYTGLHTLDGLLNGELDLALDAIRHMVLPGFTLALVQWSLLTRVLRDSLLEALRQDYVVTARAKGVGEGRVTNLHARRNAILPVISIAGIFTSLFIGNLVVIETLFNINGVGRWAAQSIVRSDIPVAVAFTLVSCFVTVSASFLADILYGVFDPRVRLN